MSEPTERFNMGMTTRRAVLGAGYVDTAVATTSALTAEFQTLITEGAWGTVWSRDTITKRERSMLTIALLAAMGHFDELALHVRATKNTGATADDIKEALLHVAIYAGVPAANHAFKIAAKALEDIESESGLRR